MRQMSISETKGLGYLDGGRGGTCMRDAERRPRTETVSAQKGSKRAKTTYGSVGEKVLSLRSDIEKAGRYCGRVCREKRRVRTTFTHPTPLAESNSHSDNWPVLNENW